MILYALQGSDANAVHNFCYTLSTLQSEYSPDRILHETNSGNSSPALEFNTNKVKEALKCQQFTLGRVPTVVEQEGHLLTEHSAAILCYYTRRRQDRASRRELLHTLQVSRHRAETEHDPRAHLSRMLLGWDLIGAICGLAAGAALLC